MFNEPSTFSLLVYYNKFCILSVLLNTNRVCMRIPILYIEEYNFKKSNINDFIKKKLGIIQLF